MAWLNATPRPLKPGTKAPPKKEGSRLSSIKDRGEMPRVPPVALGYLIEYLFDVGPVSAGGFGPVPLTHQELLAWQINMRRRLQPWEVSMLRRLSAEFAATSHAADDPYMPAPYAGPVTAEQKRRTAHRLRDSIRGMAR